MIKERGHRVHWYSSGTRASRVIRVYSSTWPWCVVVYRRGTRVCRVIRMYSSTWPGNVFVYDGARLTSEINDGRQNLAIWSELFSFSVFVRNSGL